MTTPTPLTWRVRDWAAIWLGGTLATLMIQLAVVPFWGDDIEGAGFLFLVSVPAQAIAQGAIIAAILLRKRGQLERDMGFDIRLTDLRVLPLTFLVIIATVFVGQLLVDALGITDNPSAVLQRILEASPTTLFVGAIFIVGIVPMLEEIMFRGVLQSALGAKMGPLSAGVATAAIFGAIHIFGVDPAAGHVIPNMILVVTQTFILGLFLSWLRHRDGRIGRAILAHSFNNLLALVAVLAVEAGLVT